MSSDNYWYIDHDGTYFVCTMQFASEDDVLGDPTRNTLALDGQRFMALDDAFDWCEGQYTEYGTSLSPRAMKKGFPDVRDEE